MPISAETFILKDGRVLKGKLLQYHDETIDIQTEEGQLQTIDRKAIVKVQYAEDHEVERQRKLLEKENAEKELRRKEGEQVSEKPQRNRKKIKLPEPPNYVRQSAILPGLGLLSLRRKKEGYTSSGLFFLTALFALYERKAYIESREAYEESVRNSLILSYATQNLVLGMANSRDRFREFQYEESQYNRAIMLCGVVYLGQLAWTYYLGKPSAPEKSGLEFNLVPVSTMAAGHVSREVTHPIQVHFQYHFIF
jgi:hypothetical protein